jgi:hypothetical protein
MEIQVTLIYGRDSINKTFTSPASVAQLATKEALLFLGAPTDNVKFTIFGDVVSETTTLADGDEVYVEAKPHSKA